MAAQFRFLYASYLDILEKVLRSGLRPTGVVTVPDPCCGIPDFIGFSLDDGCDHIVAWKDLQAHQKYFQFWNDQKEVLLGVDIEPDVDDLQALREENRVLRGTIESLKDELAKLRQLTRHQ